ncbi:MAG TPA: hypothetical protein VLX68_17690 [Chitinivibrionales bacterium]|nr:hypothetical protein [Chitinivibrionales bacterium]
MQNIAMKFMTPCGAFLILGFQLLFGQQVVNNWKITPGGNGRAATMVFADPSTYLKIEKDLELTVDAGGTATSGTIHFKSGFQRAMTPEEVGFYYSEFKGDNAYWDFMAQQGGVAVFTFGRDPVPPEFIGQKVRIISQDGMRYIGILSQVPPPSTGDWYSLNIHNSTMLFYKFAVKEIQRLK